MRIAVINETSAADRNSDIMAALADRGLNIVNCGMTKSGAPPELTYVHTGLLSALLLNAGVVDFVVGGCGTGQGFLNSVAQYPNVVCGHIVSPLDAWLFQRINAGNCVSLALNQGYGWGSDVNLRLVFDELFSGHDGEGFPAHRKESQRHSMGLLSSVSHATHRSFPDIVGKLPDEVAGPALLYPGIKALIDSAPREGRELADAVAARVAAISPAPRNDR